MTNKQQPAGAPIFLTIEEVAKRWRVSYDTIRRELDRGGLDFIKVGIQYRIKLASVEQRERQQKPDRPPPPKRSKRYSMAGTKDHFPDC